MFVFFVLLTCFIRFRVPPYVIVGSLGLYRVFSLHLCYETINFASAFVIVVTVCSSICSNSIITYYNAGYRQVLEFQRHRFPFFNERSIFSHKNQAYQTSPGFNWNTITYPRILSLIVLINLLNFHCITQICYLIWICKALAIFSMKIQYWIV